MSESDQEPVAPEPIDEESTTADGDDAASQVPDEAVVESPAEQPAAKPTVATARWVAAVLGGLLVASAALTAWLYFGVLRADQQLGPEAEQAVMAAAADGAVAVLTYSPKTLEQDFSAAQSHLTGDFLAYYTDFTQKVVTPAAREKDVQTVAAVVRKGIISLRPSSAEVLIFLNQTTISKAVPDGSYSMSSVKVGLEKHEGRWLISSFDPV
ncbi:twin-arginine translocation pathway signal [Mycobacterium sp. UM_Kg1]|uniref:twin-arginine translocation pathway signal n=1 Tax=Mycobacterium sp. UM_Kg1 TaxID=1545691 RepID=UPI00069809C3|nr:twin-arginine translocation pathway signal [Mycobacterium sp. UM_Kg1]